MARFNVNDIIKQIRKATEDANAANEARYTQGLAELTGSQQLMRDLYGKAGGMVQDLGKGATRDIGMGAERAYAQGRQGLISSGLGNTTITGSLMRGVEEDRRRAMERAEEDRSRMMAGLATQQAGAEVGASGGIASFIAARNDMQPDMGMYSSLLRDAVGGGGATGGGRLSVGGGGGGGGALMDSSILTRGDFGWDSGGGGGSRPTGLRPPAPAGQYGGGGGEDSMAKIMSMKQPGQVMGGTPTKPVGEIASGMQSARPDAAVTKDRNLMYSPAMYAMITGRQKPRSTA